MKDLKNVILQKFTSKFISKSFNHKDYINRWVKFYHIDYLNYFENRRLSRPFISKDGYFFGDIFQPKYFIHNKAQNGHRSFTTSNEDKSDSYIVKNQDFEEELRRRISGMINSHKVLIFMKGTPEKPQCGFSFRVISLVIKIFSDLGLEEYAYFNVLRSDAVREAIKNFSSWPTIPQVFVNGEFLGGCDIIDEMHSNGSLKEYFQKLNIIEKP